MMRGEPAISGAAAGQTGRRPAACKLAPEPKLGRAACVACALHLPICHIFMEISMKEKGMVKTQRSRSLPARLTMKMLRGDRIFGLSTTCARRRRRRLIKLRGAKQVTKLAAGPIWAARQTGTGGWGVGQSLCKFTRLARWFIRRGSLAPGLIKNQGGGRSVSRRAGRDAAWRLQRKGACPSRARATHALDPARLAGDIQLRPL